MRCPVCDAKGLVEVAPGLLQCDGCGVGPNSLGYCPTWALSFVDRGKYAYAATCVEWRGGSTYVAYSMEWSIDDSGARVGTPVTQDAIVLEPDELAEFALPIIVRSKRPYELTPGTILAPLMFQDPLGVKEVIR